MNSELEILKKIWENGGESSVRLISKQAGFGIDYIRYICNCLFQKGRVKEVRGERDCYVITSRGEKDLEVRGIIKPKVSKRESSVEKVIYYFPKKLKLKISKSNSQEVSIKQPRGNLIKPEEKKLNLGQSIEKAISALKRSSK